MTDSLIVAEHISKSYSGAQILSDVSLKINRGGIFGLLGPNGAGKTTLIRILTQITRPDTGSIFFNGEPLHQKHLPLMGYMPEERGLYKKMKVGEQLLYIARLRGLSKKEAMSRLAYWFDTFEMEKWWSKKTDELSKGMQQKLQFVSTVLHQPQLLILDEPFSGFDPVNAQLVKDEIIKLSKSGTSIILSTHRMESVEELCDHIAIIHKGHKLLDAETFSLKRKYFRSEYLFEYSGDFDPTTIAESVEIKKFEKLQSDNYAMLIVADEENAKMVLDKMLLQTNLERFEKVLPSVNDIFIELVTEKAA